MLKICISTSSFPLTREDTKGYFVLELARALVRQGHVVHVLCPEIRDADYAQEIDGVRIHRFRYWPRRYGQELIGERPGIASIRDVRQWLKIPFFVVQQFITLFRLIRRERIDIVNSHWVIPQGVIAALACRLLGIPHVPTLHSTDVYLASRLPLGSVLSRFVDRTAAVTFIVSSFVKARYDRILGYSSQANIVPMGVDTERFKPDEIKHDEANATVLFVGRLVPIKGVDVLLNAIKLLCDEGICPKLVIAGDGEAYEDLRDEAVRLGIGDVATFLGSVANEELPFWYRRASIVVIPSRVLPSGETEGLPVVTLEALASGVPVIASDVGGISDVVENEVNGFLVRPDDAVSLADAIRLALAKRERLAGGALSSADRYSWRAIVAAYINEMQRVVSQC